MRWDHSSRQKYQACPRKWLLEEHYLLEPKEDKTALVRGGAIHHGIATWYQTKNIIEAGQEAIGELVRRGEVSEMELTQGFKDLVIDCLLSYSQKYPEEPFEVLDVELSMCHQLSEDDFYFGVCDALVAQGGVVFNKETKTTSLMPSFLEQRYVMDEQTLGYVFLASKLGIPTKGVLLDIVRVPNGKSVKYPEFHRSLHFPDEQLVVEFESELRAQMQFIKAALSELEAKGILLSNRFPKNTKSCFDWNKRCGFFDFCSRPSLQQEMWSTFQRKSTSRTDRIMKEALEGQEKLIRKYEGR